MATAEQDPVIENVYKVKLVPASLRNTSIRDRRVTFDVTPDLIENNNVNYKSIDPVHAPGQIYVYGNTASRTFNLSNARLISRTVEEADLNLRRLWLLRSWTKSYFGRSSTLSSNQVDYRTRRALDRLTEAEQSLPASERRKLAGSELLGRPPEILLLSAYSGSRVTNKIAEHINRVPVALQQLSVPLPSDVDYINTSSGVPMPTIMTLDMMLLETHSAREYEKFSIHAYRAGVLEGF